MSSVAAIAPIAWPLIKISPASTAAMAIRLLTKVSETPVPLPKPKSLVLTELIDTAMLEPFLSPIWNCLFLKLPSNTF